ncbi:hypothetical protein PHJA_002641200 [Phtheirospermum japonicum]|uniref:Uncharacterized protein n=1 Tax=Phtheirospermum japonicum TaxID=374723 RepID=A0A830CYG1_9LAMI|nr:hypothetical protein PHJA_002641200 [Phtheirospermum japonicum]
MEDCRIWLKHLSASKNKPEAPTSAAAAPLLFSKVNGSGWAPSRYAGAILFGINWSIGVSPNAGDYIFPRRHFCGGGGRLTLPSGERKMEE